MKLLVVVDVQKDFVTGALANPEAEKRMPNVINKITEANRNGDKILFTRDTHFDNYMETLEGKKLPVPHCIINTEGHDIVPEALAAAQGADYYCTNKLTFGAEHIGEVAINLCNGEIDEIEIIGFVSSICVISNALLLRAYYPNTPITIDASCCAGLAKEDHDAAMTVAQCCQIDVVNWER